MMRFLTMTFVFLLRMSSLKDNCLKHDQMMKYFGMKLHQLSYCLVRLGFAILFIPFFMVFKCFYIHHFLLDFLCLI